jgi:ATP-dependent DNA ligase
MLAKLAEELPPGGGYLYEPKWDGFRAIVFRGTKDVYIQSRDSRPLDRYFPELHDALLERLPKDCVVDGEIVIATAHGARLRCSAAPSAPGGVARRQARKRNTLLVRCFRRACGQRT